MLIEKLVRLLYPLLISVACSGSFVPASVASAQTGGDASGDRITVAVVSADSAKGTEDTLVRLPTAAGSISPPVLLKLLPNGGDSFFAKASVKVAVGADDKATNCNSMSATIWRQAADVQQRPTPIALDVCPMLLASIHFHHALAITGHAIASMATLSVILSHHVPLVLVAPPDISRTSGHVLSRTADTVANNDARPIVEAHPILSNAWADTLFWLNFGNPLPIETPNWAAALGADPGTPKTSRVGALVKLAALHGFYSFVSCKVVMSGGDASVDDATCKALTSNRRGDAHDGTLYYDNYPVIVQWHGRDADVIAPALPSVPHMPRDVPLTAADKPASGSSSLPTIPLRILLDTQGHGTECMVMRSGGDDALDAASCQIALQRAQFTPALDEFGRPALGLYEAVADWPEMSIHPTRR